VAGIRIYFSRHNVIGDVVFWQITLDACFFHFSPLLLFPRAPSLPQHDVCLKSASVTSVLRSAEEATVAFHDAAAA